MESLGIIALMLLIVALCLLGNGIVDFLSVDTIQHEQTVRHTVTEEEITTRHAIDVAAERNPGGSSNDNDQEDGFIPLNLEESSRDHAKEFILQEGNGEVVSVKVPKGTTVRDDGKLILPDGTIVVVNPELAGKTIKIIFED